MIEHQIKIEGELSPCRRCGRQPRHFAAGEKQHFLECSPCRSRTSKFPTFQEAVEAWESASVEDWRAVG